MQILKRHTDFCNQKEANRQGRQIKTKQHKGTSDIEKWNRKITQRYTKRKSPEKN